jgi:hypothetical protein
MPSLVPAPIPQPPQLLGSLARSTHLPPQHDPLSEGARVQPVPSTKPVQSRAAQVASPHAVPEGQAAGSWRQSKYLPPSFVMQTPWTQEVAPGQIAPQPSQFEELEDGSTHIWPQQMPTAPPASTHSVSLFAVLQSVTGQ